MPFATGVRIGHPATEAVFGKYFRNRIAVLELAQPNALGADVRVAVKVDVSQWGVAKMKLYSYDRVSNSYSLLKNGNFFVDANNYLHFTTNTGGILIVSEGLLTRE